MKVLYVAGLFRKKSCSASIRNVALVNGLQNSGCDVTVLTVQFPNEVLDPYLIASVNQNVNIIDINAGYISSFIPSIYRDGAIQTINKPSVVKKFIKNVIYFPSIDKNWISNINSNDYKGYDLVISSSDTKTSHFVANKIIKNNPMEWLQIWGDPWAEDIGLNNKFLQLRASFAEKKLLNSAKYIGYVSLPTANSMSSKYPNFKDKIRFIPRNFFKSIKKKSVNEAEFKIAYTGVLKGRDITPIIEAIQLYNMGREFKVILDIYGRISSEQEALISQSDYIQFHGEVSLEQVYEVFESADALLYLGNAAGASQIPGKLYDYFGTNLPILALVQDMEDEVSKFILSSNRCLVFENNKDSIELAALLKKQHSFDILQQYSPESVASEIMKIIPLK